MAREHIEKEWVPYQEVKVFPLSKKYTFDLACRLFMSVIDPLEIKKLADPFHLVTNGMFTVSIDFPGTAYNGAIKGGKLVREELMRIIRERRNYELIMMEMENKKEILLGGRDLLSRMLLVRDEDGKLLSEMEISNHIIGLLVASYETTSTALTFVFEKLCSASPHIQSGSQR